MKGLHYPNLTIEMYRGLTELAIPALGRVNLIAGKNNSGKTSLLEALYLHSQKASFPSLRQILKSRDELEGLEHPQDPVPERVLETFHLFHGFVHPLGFPPPVVVSTDRGKENLILKLRMGWVTEVVHDEGNVDYEEWTDETPGDAFVEAALFIETESTRRSYELDRLGRLMRSSLIRRTFDRPRMPASLVRAGGLNGEFGLEPLWTEIDLTDKTPHVIEALRIIDPSITAVSMVGNQSRPVRPRIPMVRSDRYPQRIPLRSFGEGMNRLFEMILSLVNAEEGILLLDEFENGLHYSVQLDAWRMIFRLAAEMNIQVFATTHSSDAIRSFQSAASESPEQGMFLRLTNWEGGHILLLWGEDALEEAVRFGIEGR